jgi:hypothetical protein
MHGSSLLHHQPSRPWLFYFIIVWGGGECKENKWTSCSQFYTCHSRDVFLVFNKQSSNKACNLINKQFWTVYVPVIFSLTKSLAGMLLLQLQHKYFNRIKEMRIRKTLKYNALSFISEKDNFLKVATFSDIAPCSPFWRNVLPLSSGYKIIQERNQSAIRWLATTAGGTSSRIRHLWP